MRLSCKLTFPFLSFLFQSSEPSGSVAFWSNRELQKLRRQVQELPETAIHVWTIPQFGSGLDGLQWHILEDKFKNAVRISLLYPLDFLSSSERDRLLRLVAVLKEGEKFTDEERRLWRRRDEGRRAWEQMAEFTSLVEQLEKERQDRNAKRVLRMKWEAGREAQIASPFGPRGDGPFQVSFLPLLAFSPFRRYQNSSADLQSLDLFATFSFPELGSCIDLLRTSSVADGELLRDAQSFREQDLPRRE